LKNSQKSLWAAQSALAGCM